MRMRAASIPMVLSVVVACGSSDGAGGGGADSGGAPSGGGGAGAGAAGGGEEGGGGASAMGGNAAGGEGGAGGGPSLPLGEPCAADPECSSGHCADGVCCDVACEGECLQCDAAGAEGACLALEAQAACTDGVCDGGGACVSGGLRFAKVAGDAAAQRSQHVTFDPQGSVILAGQFSGSIALGGAPLTTSATLDAFVAKLGPTGDHVWSKSFATSGSMWSVAVATDAVTGRIVLSGNLDGVADLDGATIDTGDQEKGFIMALAADGTYEWHRTYEASILYDNRRLTVSDTGRVVVAGAFQGGIDFGDGPQTAAGSAGTYVASFDDTGELEWSVVGSVAGSGGQQAVPGGLVTGAGGTTYVAGYFVQGDVTFGSVTLPVAGVGQDIYLVAIDTAGQVTWANGYGSIASQILEGMTVDPAGNLWLVGSFNSSLNFGGGDLPNYSDSGQAVVPLDLFVAKLDPQGGHLESRAFGPFQSVGFLQGRVAADGNGNVAITGKLLTSTPVDFGLGPVSGDSFLVKLASDLTPLWSRGITGLQFSGSTNGNRLAAGADGSVALSGWTSTSVDFGGGALSTAGSEDAAIAVYDP